MTTLRQIEANRLNAQRSTGPRTTEGKEQARRNALKHGLAGAGVVLPDDESEAIQERLAQWYSSIRPWNPYEVWLTEQIVVASVQIDRCQHEERTLRTEQARRAETSWNADRTLAAEILAGGLSKKPALVSRQLRQTLQGCHWLIARWIMLGQVLVRSEEWTGPQQGLALDLLGIAPELRDGPTTLTPPPGADRRDYLLALVDTELATLRTLQETVLADRDAREQAAAELGLERETSRPLSLLRRYEAAWQRRMQSGLKQLRRGRPSTSQAAPTPAATVPIDARLIPEEGDDPLRVSTLEEETARLAETPSLGHPPLPEPSPAPAPPTSVPDPFFESLIDAPPAAPSGGNRRTRLAARRRRRQQG